MLHFGVKRPVRKGRRSAGAQILWPERRALKLQSPKQDLLVQIPWSKGTAWSPSRHEDEGDISIVKGL